MWEQLSQLKFGQLFSNHWWYSPFQHHTTPNDGEVNGSFRYRSACHTVMTVLKRCVAPCARSIYFVCMLDDITICRFPNGMKAALWKGNIDFTHADLQKKKRNLSWRKSFQDKWCGVWWKCTPAVLSSLENKTQKCGYYLNINAFFNMS